MAIASPLIPAEKIDVILPDGVEAFRWEFREKSERAVIVGKSVRAASGIRGAMFLVDNGFIEECGTVLRTVSDFTYEIMSICSAMRSGKPTEEQTKFVKQYFAELPETGGGTRPPTGESRPDWRLGRKPARR
jgi:hypothetical protein